MFDAVPPANRVKDFWDIAAHIGNVIGLVAAGVWAYFNFIESRTYHPRMELSVSGKIYSKADQRFLIPRVTLQNIGMSKVELLQRGSGYRVWFTRGGLKVGGHLAWFGGKPVYRMFEAHAWIEPGESIFNEIEIHSVPSDAVAAKIEARLRAPVGRRVSVWTCSAVIAPKEQHEEEEA